MAKTVRRRRDPPATTDDRAVNFDSLLKVQDQVGPIFVYAANVAKAVEPVFTVVSDATRKLWAILAPYHPEDLLTALYGFFLVFFGGVFMTLVASVEAAHQFGWDRIKRALIALNQEWNSARRAFERDSQIDSDYDGVADINELSATDLAARRLMVLSKSIDPQNVSVALEGLTMATVAILATLRVRFAKAITLGTAIGDVLHKVLSPFTTQLLEYALPDDYEKWIPVISKYGFRYAGVSVSWILMRAVTSVFAAMRGSTIFITGVCAYLVRYQYVGKDIFEQGNLVLVAAWAVLAILGVYTQLSSGFRLPFPLNLLLLPLTIAEQLVVFAVGNSA